MSDLIDRKAAIDVIDKIFPADPMRNDYTKGITCGAALAKEYIKQLPPAEPKKGKWTNAYDGNDGHVKCTACFKTYDYITQAQYFNYCPNCGAKMEASE